MASRTGSAGESCMRATTGSDAALWPPMFGRGEASTTPKTGTIDAEVSRSDSRSRTDTGGIETAERTAESEIRRRYSRNINASCRLPGSVLRINNHRRYRRARATPKRRLPQPGTGFRPEDSLIRQHTERTTAHPSCTGT